MMNRNVLDAISQRYLQGERPSAIAATLGISVNTVKSHLRRHPIDPSLVYCQNCGVVVPQTEGRKRKKFCSDKCRITWWNHRYRGGGSEV